MKFKTGDPVHEVDRRKRRGKIRQEPGQSSSYPMCYLVQFEPDGMSNYLTEDEIEHVSAVERLGDLA